MAMVSRHSNKSPKTSPLRDDPYLMLLKFLRQGVFFFYHTNWGKYPLGAAPALSLHGFILL